MVCREAVLGLQLHPDHKVRAAAIIQLLVQKGIFTAANVDMRHPTPFAPVRSLLDVAVSTGDFDAIKTVLDLGANPDCVLLRTSTSTPDDWRTFPLRAAVTVNNVPIARLLLARGVDPRSSVRKIAGETTPTGHPVVGSEL